MTAIDDALRREISTYTSPVQVFDGAVIRHNIEHIIGAMGDPDDVLFAVKSFPSRTVLEWAAEAGTGFEISSPSEYALLPPDLSSRTVSLNPPAPGDLARFTDRGNRLYVHLDSTAHVDDFQVPDGVMLGLRLSHTGLGLEEAESDQQRPSRFGVSAAAFVVAAPLFRDRVLRGVHVHNGSEVNTASFYRAALQLILAISHEHDIPLEFINLGGGFHPIAGADVAELLPDLRRTADPIRILVEPGHVLSQRSGFLLSRVIDIRRLDGGQYDVALDSSYECHAKWSHLEWLPPQSVPVERCRFDSLPDVTPGHQVVRFTGASCHEWDFIGVYRLLDGGPLPLQVGDVLTFGNLNGYSYAWNSAFNGIPRARLALV